jgi:hypothetical protein
MVGLFFTACFFRPLNFKTQFGGYSVFGDFVACVYNGTFFLDVN